MKILVIGSGPIVIGQAAEFDYAGTQACRALREEGHEVVLVNSNPATIMTDPGVADALYIEPLTPAFLERVIARERPDALLPSLGGQTGLNLATELDDQGILAKYGVRVLGTPLTAIKMAEDRESFRSLMREIQEPVPESWIVGSEAELEAILDEVPYPCIVRPAYTLGGTGGGIAPTREDLREIGRRGLRLSMKTQIMVERSLLGWKEVEYEVMRDANGTCIAICNMENFDPMGVHTGDSIVIAPSQTLSDLEYHMLRAASLKIIQALGIEGGCNVQLAVNPESFDYYIIEVNPRVSRSSALASKATGYPIARVSAKIAVGLRLDEIPNAVTGTTMAAFEPALDYVVVKIPRWPFDKFPTGDRTLFTQMKATGEVMAIDRTFESAFLKAIRGLEVRQKDLRHERWERRGIGVPPMRPEGVPPSEGAPSLPDDPEGPRLRRGAYLPHLTRDGASYAVTFRTADSLSIEAARELREDRELLERRERAGSLTETERARLLASRRERLETLLDAGHGALPLRDPGRAEIVRDALVHFDGERYDLFAYAVLGNHVHAVVRPRSGHDLSAILHTWKSFTAHRLGLGELWQRESYDHLVRDERDLEAQVAYVLANPERSGGGIAGTPGIDRLAGESGDAAGEGGDALATHRRDADATTDATDDEALRAAVAQPTDDRLWAIAEALRRGWSIQEVNRLCRVDPWFLRKIANLLAVEARLAECGRTHGASEPLGALVREAFLIGYPSPTIADLLGARGEGAFAREAREEVERQKVQPVFKMVDTCAGEFESRTPYYYGTFESEDDAPAR